MAAPVPVRYDAQPMWPGITAGRDARCSCTWALYRGTWQVKVLDAMCLNHLRAVSGRG